MYKSFLAPSRDQTKEKRTCIKSKSAVLNKKMLFLQNFFSPPKKLSDVPGCALQKRTLRNISQ